MDQHFGKYANLLSNQELDVETDTTLMSVATVKYDQQLLA